MEHKNLLIVLIFCLLSQYSLAQDIIVYKSGTAIQAKVTKITSAEVEYKKWANIDGSVYSLAKDEILAINYQNGEKEMFNDSSSNATDNAPNPNMQTLVRCIVDENNQQVIDLHNIPIEYAKQEKNKKASYFFPILNITDSSILSSKELEMSFKPQIVKQEGSFDYHVLKYSIVVKNKTDKVLYVDLANSFRTYTDGRSENLYNSEEITITRGDASSFAFGSSIGIFGHSSYSQSSVTHKNEQIIAIAPHSKKELKEFKQVHVSRYNDKTISDLEIFSFKCPDVKGILKRDGLIQFSEDKTPYTRQYHIVYSETPNFMQYSYLHAKLYTKYLIGGTYQNDWQTGYGAEPKELIKNIEKFISNFNMDVPMIIGKWQKL